MYYIKVRDSLNGEWDSFLNEDGTRLTFVSEQDARESVPELTDETTKQVMAVGEDGERVSLIFTGVSPYKEEELI